MGNTTNFASKSQLIINRLLGVVFGYALIAVERLQLMFTSYEGNNCFITPKLL
jgi:hypothetical protein